MNASPTLDPHAQLRTLYATLIERQDRFEEFKRLLALYDYTPSAEQEEEPLDVKAVRDTLNERIRSWTGPFDGLSVAQTIHWRDIVVDDRFNVAISPWKESNIY